MVERTVLLLNSVDTVTFYSHFFFGCYYVLKDYVRERRGKKKFTAIDE